MTALWTHRVTCLLYPQHFIAPLILSLLLTATATAQSGTVEITGERKKWHPIALTLEGPSSSETANPNPFRDYRFDVTFSKGSKSVQVPGYFAADGNAGNSSATSGNKWRARFTPDETGTWNYKISFRTGTNVAVDSSPTAGQPNQFDGLTGTFFVNDTDKSGRDFRARGVLRQVGEHYLLFDSGEWFISNGAGSPENFLAYAGFDNTFSTGSWTPKTYSSHTSDWNSGDPTWKDSQGKGIIGAINYLSSVGINGMYMLVMNTQGDGKDTFPWIAHEDFFHFDVSKLEQWAIVFDHMSRKGIMPMLVLQEMDIEHLLDNGELGVTRKMFYREMMARFNHLNGVTWNIGEEHRAPELGGNTNAQRLDFVNYLTDLDRYDHPVVMHTSSGENNYNNLFGPFLGHDKFGGMSYHIHGLFESNIDTGGGLNTYKYARIWRENSAQSGRKWIITLDECCGWDTGVRPDQSNLEPVRKDEMWGTLMAGASGFNWYLGFDTDRRDLTLQDFRRYDFLWKTSTIATDFFRKYVPFADMAPVDNLVPIATNRVLAKRGETYVVFLREGGSTTLNLESNTDTYSVAWYDPRKGGELIAGTIQQIKGPGIKSLGQPPYDTGQDWVVLVGNQVVENVLSARFSISTAEEFFALDFDASTSTSTQSTITAYEWDFGDGSTGQGKTTQHVYAEAGFYDVTLTVSDALGTADEQTQTVQVKHPTATGSFIENDGMLVVEAEDFEQNTAKNGQVWVLDRDQSGFEGAGSMAVLPDAGGFYGTGYSGNSPNLEYLGQFSGAGVYYVWLRVFAENLDGNSLHVGLNGQEMPSAEALETNRLSEWVWLRTRKNDGGIATLSIGESGENRISIWAREDGLFVDRLLLTSDASFTPSGAGPARSFRTGEVPAATFTATPAAGKPPLEVRFDASGSSAPFGTTLSYAWDFGDGQVGDGETVSHTYENDGSFEVVLQVNASNGHSASESRTIHIASVRPESHEVHVQEIAVDVRQRTDGQHVAEARIAMVDEHDFPVAGVTITGQFLGEAEGQRSGATNEEGIATFESNPSGSIPALAGFCVDQATHPSLPYNPDANADPGFACLPDSQVGLDDESELPGYVRIDNYPNPLRSKTTFVLQAAEPGWVSLKIFNALGQEVAQPIREWKGQGRHEIVFEANDLSPGLYFYTLEVNEHRHSNTMLVIR